jgi:hypothetical protein
MISLGQRLGLCLVRRVLDLLLVLRDRGQQRVARASVRVPRFEERGRDLLPFRLGVERLTIGLQRARGLERITRCLLRFYQPSTMLPPVIRPVVDHGVPVGLEFGASLLRVGIRPEDEVEGALDHQASYRSSISSRERRFGTLWLIHAAFRFAPQHIRTLYGVAYDQHNACGLFRNTASGSPNHARTCSGVMRLSA